MRAVIKKHVLDNYKSHNSHITAMLYAWLRIGARQKGVTRIQHCQNIDFMFHWTVCLEARTQ